MKAPTVLSSLAHQLLDEPTLVPHEGAQLLNGRTPEVSAALEELRKAGLIAGNEVLRVAQLSTPSRPTRLLVKVSASRKVLHRVVMDGSHCGVPRRKGTWVEPEEALAARGESRLPCPWRA